jgi:hypothetical protein
MEHSKESFINEIKNNPKFSEKWGLKIEERELSLEERETLLLEIDDTFRTSTTLTTLPIASKACPKIITFP